MLDEFAGKKEVIINTEKEVSGIVVNKYKRRLWYGNSRDQIPMLKLCNSTCFIEFDVLGWSRNNNSFWKYVEIGDSVSKPAGTLQLRVVKPYGETKLFRYYSLADVKKEKRLFFRD